MPTIYHYTDVHGFFEMISKRKLWLSGTNNLNDKTERIHGKDRVLNALREFEEFEGKDRVVRQFLDFMGHSQYVCSFSQYGDSLSQWRGYADDGFGFAIGFNSDAFPENYGFSINTPDAAHATSLRKVEYDSHEQDLLIHKIIDDAKRSKFKKARDREFFLLASSAQLASTTIALKNKAFEDEAEWRLVHSPVIDLKPSDGSLISCKPEHFKQRVSRNRICTYFEHSFKAEAIERIMVGPKCLVHNEDLQLLLRTNGIAITPEHSAATYR